MTELDGFAPIEALFYTVFHPTEGTKVSQQVPEGSAVTSSKTGSEDMTPLFDFDSVKNYIIPKAPLCDKLVTLKVGKYRLVGYPVSITAPHYARNSFSFNFCFVFNYDSDTAPYESSIKRLGKMFKNLEEQYQILSRKEDDDAYFTSKMNPYPSTETNYPFDQAGSNSFYSLKKPTENQSAEHFLNGFDIKSNPSAPIGVSIKRGRVITLKSIESLIQQIYQDLNNYSECLIPIDNGNSVDIKLLPIMPPPPEIFPEDVPISTVNLQKLVDVNWDPTMLKILPYINGVNSVKRISKLIDGEYAVVSSVIQDLMYYGCIILTDIFQFSNIYAPTSNIDLFLKDNNLAAECQAYVVSPPLFQKLPFDSPNSMGKLESATRSADSLSSRELNSAISLLGPRKLSKETVILPTKAKLFYLYRSLHQGQSLKQWYKEHVHDLVYIDVRRFITFGVLRGLIYRIQSYLTADSLFQQNVSMSDLLSQFSLADNRPTTGVESGYARNKLRTSSAANGPNQTKQIQEIIKHLRNVDSFDLICTNSELDPKTVNYLLRKIGHHNVINS